MKVGTLDINKIYVESTEIPKIYLGDTVVYESGPAPHDYSKDYLTFRIISGGTFNWITSGTSATAKTIQYSTDNGSTWTSITSSSAGADISVSAGDVILFKGTNTNFGDASYFSHFTGSSACRFEVEGNIFSIVYGDSFSGQTTVPQKDFLFANLFQDCVCLTSAENLILPAKNLKNGNYGDYSCKQMFKGCSRLTTAPKLPATGLTINCYQGMFSACTSLTTAPELPATTLADYCYYAMFNTCSALTTAPELPATTLTKNCYYQMFNKCSSLTTAPELPATTLVQGCYNQMFYYCSKLNYIKCLALTGINTSSSTSNWVFQVKSTGTFVKASGSDTWPVGTSGIPSGWTIQEV